MGKWRAAQKHIRCDLCKLTVGNTFESVGESFTEDDVYNHIEKICDVQDIYDKHELKEIAGTAEAESTWQLTVASVESPRSAHTIRWQSHAMKELCDNII